MKNLPIIVSVAALLISVMLLIKNFSGKEDKVLKENKNNSELYDIAYVNLDTLLDAYHLITDRKVILHEKTQKISAEIESRYKSIQLKAMDLQKQVQNRMMTPSTAQKKEQQLMAQQQQLMDDKQRFELEIMEDEQKLMLEFLDSVKNYLAIYNADKKYKMIISNDTVGRTILLAEPGLNITENVIKNLNDRYLSSKNK